MRRYMAKQSWMDDERLHVPSITVIEADNGWVKSGLLDHHGNELMSCERTGPIGFLAEFFKDK